MIVQLIQQQQLLSESVLILSLYLSVSRNYDRQCAFLGNVFDHGCIDFCVESEIISEKKILTAIQFDRKKVI